MPPRPPRRKPKSKSASSPVRTPKRQSKLNFSSPVRRKSSSSSPIKHEFQRERSDASSDVNEVQFEEAGTRKRRKVQSSSDGVIDLESSEAEDVAKRKKKEAPKARVDSDESDEEEVSAKRRGKRKAITLSMTPSSDDEDHRRNARIVRRGKAPSEERDTESEDMMDGLDEGVVLDSRLRSAPTRNTKMAELRQNLARLKRRKLGQDASPVHSPARSSSESEDEEQVVRPRGRRIFKPLPGAQPTLQDYFASGSDHDKDTTNTGQKDEPEEADSDDQDSWIEDDGGEANVPMLPEAYSMFGHQSLAHHFKVVMQLFVHLACLKERKRWAFIKEDKNDEYFGLSLRALRRKLDGMRDSLVVSSVWTSGFKKALNQYPELNIFGLKFAVPGCGACRISSRMSTYRGSLDGDEYDRDTFGRVTKEESDDDSDDDSDEELPTSFDLGRYCQARVQCYHDFVHWERQLFETINCEIEVLRTARKRKDPSGAERPAANDPDGIMGWLDRRGIVEREWQRLERLMEAARGLEFKKGAEDD